MRTIKYPFAFLTGALLTATFLTLRGQPVTTYASPTGTGVACTLASPCSLQTALSAPGGQVYLRAGNYVGHFSSPAPGPVTISSYPGERATLQHDGTNNNLLEVTGSKQTWRDLEFTGRAPAVNPPRALLSITGDGHKVLAARSTTGTSAFSLARARRT
jgi:hypothetical protein